MTPTAFPDPTGGAMADLTSGAAPDPTSGAASVGDEVTDAGVSLDVVEDIVGDVGADLPGEVVPEVSPDPARRSAPGLSPSRANDFLRCPLLFRLRVIDRLPEPPSAAAARGTLVHAVLEHLFDLSAGDRTRDAAVGMLPGAWQTLHTEQPGYLDLFDAEEQWDAWFASARDLLDTYFTLEDPNRLQPHEREVFVRTQLEDGPQLRGIIDRLDVAPDGAIRVVDYKTGRSPRAGYESAALFQMRFYAYVLWRERGVLPTLLQLEYLGDGQIVRHAPSEPEMTTFETRVRSIWAGIEDSARSGDWRPRPSKLCDWCSFKAVCPAFGGVPPTVPEGAVEAAIGVAPTVGVAPATA
ncbi:MAG TPA: PD-(D/E)XK nuclease family protein [Cellulomonas sp.]